MLILPLNIFYNAGLV